METKFQTSFIPKKPLVSDSSKSVPNNHGGSTFSSIFSVISIIIFLGTVGMAGFSVVWKGVLLENQKQYQMDLEKNEQSFNSSLIEELKKASAKLDIAKGIVRSHVAVSEVFKILSRLTIEGVRFKDLTYEGPSGNGNDGSMAKVSLKGIATSYRSIAYQSDVFGQSSKFGTNKVIRNPLLSDMSLDQDGRVSFSFSANIEPELFTYEKVYTETLKSEGLLPEDNNVDGSQNNGQ